MAVLVAVDEGDIQWIAVIVAFERLHDTLELPVLRFDRRIQADRFRQLRFLCRSLVSEMLEYGFR